MMKNTWKKAPGGIFALILICSLLLSGCGGQKDSEAQVTVSDSEIVGTEEAQQAENTNP